MTSKIHQLIDLHSALLKQNPFCYFELAYTRRTEWMAWLCTNAQEIDPNRVVLACGQGSTAEEAADRALAHYCNRCGEVMEEKSGRGVGLMGRVEGSSGGREKPAGDLADET